MTSDLRLATTKCPRCGHPAFSITETYVYAGTVNPETGVLSYSSWPDGGGRERIACARCEFELSEDVFTAVEHY